MIYFLFEVLMVLLIVMTVLMGATALLLIAESIDSFFRNRRRK